MFTQDNIEKIATIYGFFYSRKDELITNQLRQYSAHTRNELAMLKSVVRVGDNIIDIGAHIGTFSIPFASFNKGKGVIFSFEANPDNYNLLLANISENCLGQIIMPFHAIVSDDNKMFTMLKTCDDNSGTYCFLPDHQRSDLSGSDLTVINIDEWYERNEIGLRIDLIKIDIEGAEVTALHSCKRIIDRYKPLIYIEISVESLARFRCTVSDVENFMKFFGYHLFKNAGLRNSDNDIFEMTRLTSIAEGGDFFDLLAIHPTSHSYPDIA